MIGRRTSRTSIAMVLIALCLLVGPSGGQVSAAGRRTLTVSTAASMAAPLKEAAQRFERENPDVEVLINTGASGVLVQQLLRGAPADLIVTASPEELDRLDEKGMLSDNTRCNLASNQLVILLPLNGPRPRIVQDLVRPEFDLIAVGNPETSPLGRYTKDVFDALYIGETLQPRLVRGENAQQVVRYVARGDVSAGVTYVTDARLAADRVVVGPSLPTEFYTPIVYQAAVLKDTPDLMLALSFIVTINGEQGRRLFEKHGFTAAP